MSTEIKAFFDERTYTMTYVVFDPETRDAVVIDPVLDYDPASSKIWTESADEVIAWIEREELTLHAIMETHAHADHLSGSQVFKQSFPEARLAVGADITKVQSIFKGVFDLPEDFPTDGSQFDALIEPGATFTAGSLTFEAIPTPGHTPACMTYLIADAAFTGDTLFMPDMGTGRCDFPGGSACALYDSVMRLYELPGDTVLYVGHDYQPGGRELKWAASVAEHREANVALPASRSKEDFVAWREARDATLNAPKLLFQSVQVNVDAGALPKPSDNQVAYLKIPINVFRPAGGGDMEYDEV
ncbi:MAG: MBL fold metallo-hydrolase [Myxococcota bacterium]